MNSQRGRKGKDGVEIVDFDEAIDRIVVGLEKKTRVMSPQERETGAYHRAGHALVPSPGLMSTASTS